MAENEIPKPAFDVFELLHMLGTERLAAAADDVLVTRRKDGTLVIAAWNLVEPGADGAAKSVSLDLRGVASNARATIRRVDGSHGDTLDAWKAEGSPKYPTQSQTAALRKAAELGPPEVKSLHGGRLELTLPPMGLAVVEIR
jgi:xylan 1,4-beta-xylosidase